MLVKTTALLKLPEDKGLKVTVTSPVWPGATFKEPPAETLKGAVVATLTVNVKPPVFTNWKL